MSLPGEDDTEEDGDVNYALGIEVDASRSSDEYDAVSTVNISGINLDNDFSGTDGISAGGRYVITNKQSGLSLEVVGGSVSYGTNIAQTSYTELAYQEFELLDAGGGYYDLRALHSNKSVDVAGGSSSSGANVQQWDSNGSDAQLWQIVSTGDGYYNIINKVGGHYLGVDGGSLSSGANVSVLLADGTDNQKWLFTSTDAPSPSLPSLVVSSTSVSTEESGLTDSFTVALSVAPLSDVVVNINSVTNGDEFSLDTTELTFTTSNWDQAQTVVVTGEDDTEEDGDVNYALGIEVDASRSSDEYDAVSTVNISGINLDNDFSGTDGISAGGRYVITNKQSGLSLEVVGGSVSYGTNIAQTSYTELAYQEFELLDAGGGYYDLRALHSNKSVDVAGGSSSSGANVQQWDSNGSDAQLWQIVSTGDGYYNIINKVGGHYLGVTEVH